MAKIVEYLLFFLGVVILALGVLIETITGDGVLWKTWQFYVIVILLLSTGYFLKEHFKKIYTKLPPHALKGATTLMLVGYISFAVYVNWEDQLCNGYIDDNWESSRIYLSQGAIYAFKDNPTKEYDIVNGVFHVTEKQYCENIQFFDSVEEAEAAGYKPSEANT